MKITILACLLAASCAHAATFSLSLTGAAGSRWYEYFSDAYAELGTTRSAGGDGFWSIGSPGTPVGDGSSDVFLNDGLWDNIGTIGWADGGLTGTGVESAAITAFSANFASYIADNDSIMNGPYTTTINSFTGTVNLVDGAVASILLSANVTFTYDGSGFGLGSLDYTGDFIIDGDTFTLDVDGSYPTFPGLEPARYVWDVNGSVNNLVPEPGAFALLLPAMALFARRRR